MSCRFCKTEELFPFIDLGTSPPSNAYLSFDNLNKSERWYPLKVNVCPKCFLVQTDDYTDASDLFDQNYAYFSSYSKTMLEHSKKYVNEMLINYNLNENSYVVEIAANDGYLLQYFIENGVPCLGVEPTSSTATAARDKGIEIIEEFFGVNLAKKLTSCGKTADLVIANNVLAHVPDINDFVQGVSILLNDSGVATFEFPYLINLIEKVQFDTIYHEHFSYLSLSTVSKIFTENGLEIFDVETHDIHGGSLRVFAQKNNTKDKYKVTSAVKNILQYESINGYLTKEKYRGFQLKAEQLKDDFVKFLIEAKKNSKKVFAYGAAAKGNTFINFSGIRKDLIQCVIDRNPAKQKKYLPGSRIPIFDENEILSNRPDYIVILPWNLENEIISQLDYVREWGGEFVIAIPELKLR